MAALHATVLLSLLSLTAARPPPFGCEDAVLPLAMDDLSQADEGGISRNSGEFSTPIHLYKCLSCLLMKFNKSKDGETGRNRTLSISEQDTVKCWVESFGLGSLVFKDPHTGDSAHLLHLCPGQEKHD
ncbi:uncharacterized protein LOC108931100 isoform X1 [Arapaima gigas]